MATETSRPKVARRNVLRGVDWDSYVRMRNHPGNGHLRMSYLDGTLILVSPEFIHDRYGWRLAKIVDEVTEALGILVQGTATTTLRRAGDGRRKGSAKEPDFGFYFGENASRGCTSRTQLDLDVDPPPDLAIEIDNKADSSKALALYARIGVPEVWRYKARKQVPVVRPAGRGRSMSRSSEVSTCRDSRRRWCSSPCPRSTRWARPPASPGSASGPGACPTRPPEPGSP